MDISVQMFMGCFWNQYMWKIGLGSGKRHNSVPSAGPMKKSKDDFSEVS